MSPLQLAFVNKLNQELSKVEHFFIERETEARVRSLELQEQLEELKGHRRLYHVTGSSPISFFFYVLLTGGNSKDAHPEDHHPTPFSVLLFARSSALKQNRSPKFIHNNEPIESHDADTAEEPHIHHLAGGGRLDPDEYLRAREQLKRAVSEHYYALEVLNNYRV
jgi:hypothetical protein